MKRARNTVAACGHAKGVADACRRCIARATEEAVVEAVRLFANCALPLDLCEVHGAPEHGHHRIARATLRRWGGAPMTNEGWTLGDLAGGGK